MRATIHIDGRDYEVDAGDNLLHACLSLGFDLPYFCWHPALGSVGACRQCAVKQYKDENDRRGRLVMACMTPATDGTRISIADSEAHNFRSRVIEWLMTNHPHDCPVCPEGSECHLQDMTVMTGHVYRRFRGRKRTFTNQYIGPFLNHEMNRCIACYRCVRFYHDYAGGTDLQVFAIHNEVYFGRAEDGVLESEFSGNLAEVCPTGVFTDRPYGARYTRKWDLRSAPSVCAHCGVGCNISPGERDGELRRVLNRYHHDINGYFLCDRGRFGHAYVNSEKRIRSPRLRPDPSTAPRAADRNEALSALADLIGDRNAVLGIGSPRASLEANFALRTLVGPERFHLGLPAIDRQLLERIVEILRGPAPAATIRTAEKADAVLVLGEDVSDTAPRLALALRQAVRQRSLEMAVSARIPAWQDAAVREHARGVTSPLFIAAPDATRLDDVATGVFRAAPDDVARLGFAVAHEIDSSAPAVDDLAPASREQARGIAQALRTAKRPLVVAGIACHSPAILGAAANLAWALRGHGHAAELFFAVPECNSIGMALMQGGDLDAAFEAIRAGKATTLIVLENDIYRRAPRTVVDAVLTKLPHLVVLDSVVNETAARAEIALPASPVPEAGGTLVNNETRAQRFMQVYVPPGDIQESWRWLRDAMRRTGRADAEGWHGLDAVTDACARAVPALASIVQAAPPAGFRIAGQRIAREPQRYSGRTAMRANVMIHEPEPPPDPDTAMSFTMEGYYGQMPSALIPYYWSPGWNSVQALNKFQEEVGGPLRGGDPGVRLLAPAASRQPAYFPAVPRAFVRRKRTWLCLPAYPIFGSEELSPLSPAIAERIAPSHVALNPDDAAGLGVGAGQTVAIELDDTTYRLPVRLHPALPRGLCRIPVGLPGLPYLPLPGPATITPDGSPS